MSSQVLEALEEAPPSPKKPRLSLSPLPHSRADCPERSFRASVCNASYHFNRLGCPACYCLVCDVRVTECSLWPLHCMAYFDSPLWRQLRQETRDTRKTYKVPASLVAQCVASNERMKRFLRMDTQVEDNIFDLTSENENEPAQGAKKVTSKMKEGNQRDAVGVAVVAGSRKNVAEVEKDTMKRMTEKDIPTCSIIDLNDAVDQSPELPQDKPNDTNVNNNIRELDRLRGGTHPHSAIHIDDFDRRREGTQSHSVIYIGDFVHEPKDQMRDRQNSSKVASARNGNIQNMGRPLPSSNRASPSQFVPSTKAGVDANQLRARQNSSPKVTPARNEHVQDKWRPLPSSKHASPLQIVRCEEAGVDTAREGQKTWLQDVTSITPVQTGVNKPNNASMAKRAITSTHELSPNGHLSSFANQGDSGFESEANVVTANASTTAAQKTTTSNEEQVLRNNRLERLCNNVISPLHANSIEDNSDTTSRYKRQTERDDNYEIERSTRKDVQERKTSIDDTPSTKAQCNFGQSSSEEQEQNSMRHSDQNSGQHSYINIEFGEGMSDESFDWMKRLSRQASQPKSTNDVVDKLRSMWQVDTLSPAKHIKRKQANSSTETADRLLVGHLDLWMPYCSHMSAKKIHHPLGRGNKDVTSLVKPSDFSIPDTRIEYSQIMAREMGFELYNPNLLTDRDKQYFENIDDMNYDFAVIQNMDEDSRLRYRTEQNEDVHRDVISALERGICDDVCEIRWEITHHSGAKSNQKVFSRFHPSFDKWDAEVTQSVQFERMKWLRDRIDEMEMETTLNSSNCCSLRAWIYLMPSIPNTKAYVIFPALAAMKPLRVTIPEHDWTAPTSILEHPLSTPISEKCNTFEALCPSYRRSSDTVIRDDLDEITQKLFDASNSNGDTSEFISIAGILSSVGFAVSTGYNKAAPQPQRITLPLRIYQKESLAWMMDQEAKRSINDPFWIKVHGAKFDKSVSQFYLCPITGTICSDPPPAGVGGVLADEMGLGKTLIVTSLICNTLETGPPMTIHTNGYSQLIKSRATLIVCPVSLLKQWERELHKAVSPKLKVFCWYGLRTDDPRRIADNDVVMTTYGIFAGGNYKPLLEIEWFRLVMDESTYLKGGGSSCTDALLLISSKRRWAVSGTPFGDKIIHFRSTLRLLKVIPFRDAKPFEELASLMSKTPMQLRNGYQVSRFGYLLKNIFMRHIKSQTLYGQPLVELPSVTGHMVIIKQDEQEKEIYTTFENRTRTKAAELLNCCRLGKLGPERSGKLRGMMIDLRMIASGVIPSSCLKEDENILTPLPTMHGTGAKVRQLLADVIAERERDPGSKFLVFTEYKEVQQSIKTTLRGNGFDVLTLEGHMTATKRGNIIQTFAEDNDAVVLVLSLTLGACGLTLTMANVVVLFEVSLRISKEEQAVNRIHRIGQTRPVKALTYVVEDTIDERMTQLRQRRGIPRFYGDLTPLVTKRESESSIDELRLIFKCPE